MEFSDIFLVILQAVVIIITPMVVVRTVHLLLRKIADKEFFHVPIFSFLARIQGILAGVLLLRLDFDRQYFNIEQMFMPGGPWDLTVVQFLLERANVFVYDPRLIIGLLTQAPNLKSILAIITVVILPLSLLMLNFIFWEAKHAWKGLIASAIIAILASWLTVYLVSMTFWILHLINFWSLILLILYLRYRQDMSKSEGWWFW